MDRVLVRHRPRSPDRILPLGGLGIALFVALWALSVRLAWLAGTDHGYTKGYSSALTHTEPNGG